MTAESYPEFVKRTRSKLVALAVFYGSDRAGAEDAVQEVFTRIFERWPDLTGPAPGRTDGYLDAYVQKSVRNTVFKDARRRDRVTPLDVAQLEALTPAVSIDAWVTAVDIVGKFRLLPRRQREVAVCRLLLEMSAAETAEVLGLPGRLGIWKVNSSLARARQRLTTLLDLRDEIPAGLEDALLSGDGREDPVRAVLRRAYTVLLEALESDRRR